MGNYSFLANIHSTVPNDLPYSVPKYCKSLIIPSDINTTYLTRHVFLLVFNGKLPYFDEYAPEQVRENQVSGGFDSLPISKSSVDQPAPIFVIVIAQGHTE